ncbi:hypothetical protein [uncultured Vibrio sp.]|uniref:hypothetical protein n=1 Tax=uncultured Vibrio sp. TaxID=114054 RepID=UPI0025D8616C|nr:hypothetical protein [uncultured Vibrio sp.]
MIALSRLKNVVVLGSFCSLLAILFACSSSYENTKETSFYQKGLPDSQISIVTFNNKFIGHYKKKENESIAYVLSKYDLIFIQELVAPPYDGIYPDGTSFTSDPESKDFFDAMISSGFSYVLSDEDTGASDTIHSITTTTEWFVAFYKPEVVQPKSDLLLGFIETNRSNNKYFDRVPYAFSFKATATGSDFVVISTHLAAGNRSADVLRRAEELERIYGWVESKQDFDKNFIILGDMNFKNCSEISTAVPKEYTAMNKGSSCKATNLSKVSKPYDNVLFLKTNSKDVKYSEGITVIDLITTMEDYWPTESVEPYPGIPFDGNKFSQYYSDHNPVAFTIRTYGDTD